MTATHTVVKVDPLLQTKRDFPDYDGQQPFFDWYRTRPGKTFPRTFATGAGAPIHRAFSVLRDNLLCAGAALVRGEDGLVRHACAHNPGEFVGFALRMEESDKISVYVRGVVFLKVAFAREHGVGATVVCTGIDDFVASDEGRIVGRVVGLQRDWAKYAHVFFFGCTETVSEEDVKQVCGRYLYL